MNYLDITCRNKLKPIFSQYSLLQLIDEHTHYTETSSSLIDLIFTTNVSSVLFSGVGEAFLDQNIRYLCPVYVVFNFEKYKFKCFQRKIWKYDSEALKENVQNFNWSALKNEDINIYAETLPTKFKIYVKNTFLLKQ